MQKIKVMTWNVLYKEQADNILLLVKDIDPDILCCQEITTNSYINSNRNVPKEIARLLNGDYKYFEVLPMLDDQPASMGNAIISKYPILSSRAELVQKAGSDINYSSQNRGYVEAEVKLDDGSLTVGTTHLSYVDGFVETEARAKEADKLMDLILKTCSKRFLITGDFNSAPTSSTIRKIEKLGLKSAGPDNQEPTFTTKPFKHNDFEVNGLEWRLDYIFAAPDIKVLSSKIIKTGFSDHLPIIAEVEV